MNGFGFVVRRMRWLGRVPGVPQVFDGMLLGWTALRHPRRLRVMEQVEAAALKLPGVRLSVHRLGGTGFSVEGRELGHLHGNGLLDVFTGQNAAAELVAAGRAEWHHVFGKSAWVSYWVRSEGDVAGATLLLEHALAWRLGR
jgi:hypothetical protein